MKLLQCYIDNIITNALMEDINYIDAAADNLIPPEHESSAYYVAKDSGVVCGIEIAKSSTASVPTFIGDKESSTEKCLK